MSRLRLSQATHRGDLKAPGLVCSCSIPNSESVRIIGVPVGGRLKLIQACALLKRPGQLGRRMAPRERIVPRGQSLGARQADRHLPQIAVANRTPSALAPVCGLKCLQSRGFAPSFYGN
jgi:hypothetical protein